MLQRGVRSDLANFWSTEATCGQIHKDMKFCWKRSTSILLFKSLCMDENNIIQRTSLKELEMRDFFFFWHI